MKDAAKRELLKYLILKEGSALNEIMLEFGLTKNEAIQLINEINSYFGSDVIISNSQGIYMTEHSKMQCYKSVFYGQEKLFYSHDVKDRYNLILIELVLNKGFSSLQDLANVCLVSKNTILNDFKVIKEMLAEKGMSINYSRKNGYSVLGPEFMVRNLLVETIKDIFHSTAGRIMLNEKGFVTESEIFLLRKRLEKVETRIGIKLTDEQLEELPYILQMVIKRSYNFKDNWSFKIEKYDIKNTVEYPEIKNMFWDYECLSEPDLLYLSLQVLASNMVESALQISNGDEISLAAERFINNIEIYLAIEIAQKSLLKEKLILHMGPAIYRNLIGFKINNPLTEEFIEEYQEIYNIVLKSVRPFEEIIHHHLSKEEVVYLSMIVLSWVYQTEETDKIFTGAVLCRSGTSISKLLLTTLSSMFPEIDFIGAYAVRQFKEMQKNVDFIFTTVPYESKQPTFLVPSILDKDSRIRLKSQVNMEMQGDNRMVARKLLESIKDYIHVDHYHIVGKKMEAFFQNIISDPVNEDEKQDEFFYFSIENISFVEKSIEWEYLVDFTMGELFKRNSISQHYIEETKEAFYKDYETMLIAQDIYLPHARPEYGVIKMDFQIHIFNSPVRTPSGNQVKVVVALAPDVNQKHVSTLIRLNNLFLDNELRLQIINENNKHAITQILNMEGAEE
ncbi:PRD domain-containing protein [Virgibacillus dakarensis]|uniref:Ascorbate-specific PTS system EIIA component n=1 Tax=Lentibacillus populi TaxID=1827502 RepID=A0A9W5U0U9_9BACI|nr:BglG family transcription antiterminator [Lentibacillus populi]MTW85978.1 PRD domain-containing protein [Virgibacillus dakarensis]GGB58635.1 transcriptional antiterminator [Lentibacillus populi]